MHYIPDEPGYQALQYVDVVQVDERFVYVFKHNSGNFHYSDGRSKPFLRLPKYNYDSDWYLTK
jgi:hypothetical protein